MENNNSKEILTYLILIKMEAIKARIIAMKTANIEREQLGYSLAYGPDHFFDAEKDLIKLSDEFEELLKNIKPLDSIK